MRLIFAGTPEFAARALDALVLAGHEIALVLTQPDRPAGRGLNLKRSAVKNLALERGLLLAQPETLKSAEIEARISALAADAMVVAAYGQIIPPPLLGLPRFGCVNVHASLLPRWRGAAPVQRAILAGDAVTGISIMQMDAGLDSGPVLSRHEMPIDCDDTAASLTQKLSKLGAEAVVAALPAIACGKLAALAQDSSTVTYAHKIKKGEAQIDWTLDAAQIARAVRAYNPFPGATTWLDGQDVKIWQAAVIDGTGEPGSVLAAGRDGIRVACGRDALLLTELQPAGTKRMSAPAFLLGWAVAPGARVGG